MERGCLSLSAASSSPSPAVFRRNAAHLSHNSPLQSFPASFSSISNSNRRNANLSVKALVPDLNITAPRWFPKFHDLDTTNMLLSQRIIYLGAQLDDMTADFIITQLLLLDAQDQEKDITLLINSPGGSNTAGMGIYDAMKTCKADISTINLGLAAYTSAFLLATGTKGKRFCMPNGRVVLRKPFGSVAGNATADKYIRLRERNYSANKMAKILSRITGRTEEQILQDLEHNYYLGAWEAKEYGLVDEVIDDGKPGLVAPLVDATGPPPVRKQWYLWQSGGRMEEAIRDSPDEDKKFLEQNEDGGAAEKEVAPTTS